MAAYGASVDGVLALLPHLDPLTATTSPSTSDVEHHVDRWSDVVQTRVGEPIAAVSDPSRRVALEGMARTAVELAAAAATEDSRYPERAADADTSYGNVLWRRHREVLDELLEALGIDPDAILTVGVPHYTFPPPSGLSRVGF